MRRSSLVGALFLVCHSLAIPQPGEELSLKKAVEIALVAHPEVLGARQALEVARGRFWRGISPPPASLTWSYDYVPTRRSIGAYGERKIELSQSIDFPTTIVLKGSSLSSEIDAVEADYRHTSLAVTLQVKEAYYGLLARQQKLLLAEENLAIAEDFAHKAEIRQNVGEATPLELLTAKVQRTQARNSVETARNEVSVATGELYLSLGRTREQSHGGVILTDSLVYRPYPLVFEQLADEARQSNPRVQSASFKVDAASLNRSIAWSSILPGLSLSYSKQVQAGNASFYGVAVGVSLPLWFLFDQRGQVQEATATLARAESDVRARQNEVTRDVKNACLEFTNDERQVRMFQNDLLPQAEEVFRSAAKSYEAGEISYMEFLQARQTLIAARASYIDALQHYNTTLARLENAVGRPIGE